MATEIPPSLKPLKMYIRRAEEVERGPEMKHKLVAYFCRTYAMEVGLKLKTPENNNEVQGFLIELMQKLEQDKKELPTYTLDDAKVVVESFALEVFKRADDEDRAGTANKNTARTYYSAGIFFDILRQFSDDRELEPDIKQSCLYAKWKATDIIKAIKEGRQPTPGPPGGFSDGEGNEDTQDGEEDVNGFAAPPAAPTSSVKPSYDDDVPMGTVAPAPSAPERYPSPEPTPKYSSHRHQEESDDDHTVSTSGLSSRERRDDAIEYAKFAIRAIEMDEVSLAMQRLRDAISVLKS